MLTTVASVRVLGLDPGSRCTGFGIIDWNGGDAAYVASGAISISGESFPGRLQEIFGRVRALITEYQPDEVAIERVFVYKNADSALKLGQARGAALAAPSAGRCGCSNTRRARSSWRWSAWAARRRPRSRTWSKHCCRYRCGYRAMRPMRSPSPSAMRTASAPPHAPGRRMIGFVRGKLVVKTRRT